MRKALLVGAGGLVVLAGAGISSRLMGPAPEPVFEAKNKPAEAAPICPWRNPESDLKALFPEATHTRLETHILSGQRAEIIQRLGHPPSGDDHILRRYRVYQGDTELGSIQTRRVKGTFGAIELVLATDNKHCVKGVLFQKLREPESVAASLRNPEWLKPLIGKNSASNWAQHAPELLAETRDSSDAVLAGIRTMLILLEIADHAASVDSPTAHN